MKGIIHLEKPIPNGKRYAILDDIRAIALCNMIAYHAIWNLVYLFGFDWKWYQSQAGYVWQQGICWTFLLLSGFCLPLGRKKLKRGITVLLAGCLISFVTAAVVPQNKITFGILTFIGSGMLLLTLPEKKLKQTNPWIGLLVSTGLFILTRNVNRGYLGFEGWNLCKLPVSWYRNTATAYFGFPPPDFFSSDYFPLFPWIFLLISGYFLYCIFENYNLLHYLEPGRCGFLEWTGRRSLGIYILHQPILYLIFPLIFHALQD